MISETEKKPSIIRGRLLHEQTYASRLGKRIDELFMEVAQNVVAMLAIWGIGGFVIVLQDSYPTHLLEEVIEKTQPGAIICTPLSGKNQEIGVDFHWFVI
ncbi:MAG: hypothetical protein F6K41_30305 [Symploca sp. SIO3E6]|nr:hypothetical protein [Caldora sp. SIO3E6]